MTRAATIKIATHSEREFQLELCMTVTAAMIFHGFVLNTFLEQAKKHQDRTVGFTS